MNTENQASITKWSQECFGDIHPGAIARRMNKEVTELLQVFELVKDLPVADMPYEAVNNLREECADIYIMLSQVAELLDVDLNVIRDWKMGINRKRRWEKTPDGDMQHVSKFIETGSGIEMDIKKWYVLSDAGAAMTKNGFRNPNEAFEFGSKNCTRSEMGQPWFDTDVREYPDGLPYVANIVAAVDLWDFWKKIEESEDADNN